MPSSPTAAPRLRRFFRRAALTFALLALGSLSAEAQPVLLPGDSFGQDAAVFRDGATGRPSLAAAYAFSDSVRIYKRPGEGQPYAFAEFYQVGLRGGTQDDFPRKLLAADFDRDGLDDLVVLSSGNFNLGQDGSLQLLRGTPGGELEPLPATSAGTGADFPVAAAFADVDGDGNFEIAVGHDDPPGASGVRKVEIFRYFAAGFFEKIATIALPHPSPALAFADLDGDGTPELLAAGLSQLTVLRSSTGQAEDYALAYTAALGAFADAKGLAVADDGLDGTLDAIIAADDGRVFLLRNPGADAPGPAAEEFNPASAGELLSDVIAGDWNGDALPDFLFADIDNDRALLMAGPLGAFAPEIIETGLAPRRLALADLDASGLSDLLAASETPSATLSITFNALEPTSGLTVEPVGEIDAGAWFPDSVPEVAAFAAPNALSLVACDPRSNDIIGLGSSSGGETGRVDLAQFGITRPAGCWADETTGLGEFFVTQFGDRRIYKIDAGELDDVLTASVDPGPVGLAGTTEARLEDAPGNIERPRYWVLAPGVRKLLGVDRDTGFVLEQYSLALPFTELAIDDEREMAYFGVPSRDSLWSMPMAYGVASPALTEIPLASLSPELRRGGVRGLCWEGSGSNGLTVLSNDLAAAGLGDPQAPPPSPTLEPLALRRGRRLVSLAANPGAGSMLALDQAGLAGLIHEFDADLETLLDTFEVSPARSGAYPAFQAARIAFDPVADEIIVSDARRLAFARFDAAGAFLGHFSWEGTGAEELAGSAILGLEIDAASGDLLALTAKGVVRASRSGEEASLESFGGSGLAGLALAEDGKLFALSPRVARLDALAGFGGLAERSSGSLAQLAADQRPLGLAFRPSDGALVAAFGEAGRLEAIRVAQAEEPAAVPSSGWILYE